MSLEKVKSVLYICTVNSGYFIYFLISPYYTLIEKNRQDILVHILDVVLTFCLLDVPQEAYD